MNSLDWVSKQIENLKKQIKQLKNMIKSYGEKLSNSDSDTQVISYLCHSEAEDTLQEAEYLLTIYQQIKSELEAWYVVKDKTMGNNYYYEIIIYKSEKDDYKKFEKALEV